jgi:uncharacterized protein involved in cysteine biosynthesis
MAILNSPRPSMMHVDDYRARAAMREALTRFIMGIMALLAVVLVVGIIYALVALIDSGIDALGSQMKSFADGQTGARTG